MNTSLHVSIRRHNNVRMKCKFVAKRNTREPTYKPGISPFSSVAESYFVNKDELELDLAAMQGIKIETTSVNFLNLIFMMKAVPGYC